MERRPSQASTHSGLSSLLCTPASSVDGASASTAIKVTYKFGSSDGKVVTKDVVIKLSPSHTAARVITKVCTALCERYPKRDEYRDSTKYSLVFFPRDGPPVVLPATALILSYPMVQGDPLVLHLLHENDPLLPPPQTQAASDTSRREPKGESTASQAAHSEARSKPRDAPRSEAGKSEGRSDAPIHETTKSETRSEVGKSEAGVRSEVAKSEMGVRSEVAKSEVGVRSEVAKSEVGARSEVAKSEVARSARSEVRSEAARSVKTESPRSELGARSEAEGQETGGRSRTSHAGRSAVSSHGGEKTPQPDSPAHSLVLAREDEGPQDEGRGDLTREPSRVTSRPIYIASSRGTPSLHSLEVRGIPSAASPRTSQYAQTQDVCAVAVQTDTGTTETGCQSAVTLDYGVQVGAGTTAAAVQAVAPTRSEGIQAGPIEEGRPWAAKRAANIVDPALLSAELRLHRQRRRVIDPLTRGVDKLLLGIRNLRVAYPFHRPHHHAHTEAAESLAASVKNLDDPELHALAEALDRERASNDDVYQLLRRENQELRHGWLTESSKVERLLDCIAGLMAEREMHTATLADEGRKDAEFLCHVVKRKVSAELAAVEVERKILHSRVEWWESRAMTSEPTTVMESLLAELEAQKKAFGERIAQLEEENDVLAQRVALHETRGEVMCGVATGGGDEARILTERIVQLEGDLAREKDLRVQYAVQGEIQKQVGLSEIARQREHILYQQQSLARVTSDYSTTTPPPLSSRGLWGT